MMYNAMLFPQLPTAAMKEIRVHFTAVIVSTLASESFNLP